MKAGTLAYPVGARHRFNERITRIPDYRIMLNAAFPPKLTPDQTNRCNRGCQRRPAQEVAS